MATFVKVNRLPLLLDFVQQVRNYQGFNFNKGTINTYGVIYDFHNGSTVLMPKFFFFCSITSGRILATLVKVNRLPLLIEFCSAGSKLPGSQFS